MSDKVIELHPDDVKTADSSRPRRANSLLITGKAPSILVEKEKPKPLIPIESELLDERDDEDEVCVCVVCD